MIETLKQIRQSLGKVMYKLDEFESDKGIILCSELTEGAELKAFGADGEFVDLADGEYTVAELTFSCKDGKYISIDASSDSDTSEDAPETSVETVETTVVEDTESSVETEDKTDDTVETEEQVTLSKTKHQSLLDEIEALKAKVTELSAQTEIPMQNPINLKSDNKTDELQGASRYLQFLNKK